jgi:hypothetical protein
VADVLLDMVLSSLLETREREVTRSEEDCSVEVACDDKLDELEWDNNVEEVVKSVECTELASEPRPSRMNEPSATALVDVVESGSPKNMLELVIDESVSIVVDLELLADLLTVPFVMPLVVLRCKFVVDAEMSGTAVKSR